MAKLLFTAPGDAVENGSLARVHHFACAAARRGHDATIFASDLPANHAQHRKAGGEAALHTHPPWSSRVEAPVALAAAWRLAAAMRVDMVYGLNATLRSMPPPHLVTRARVVFDFDELCSQFSDMPLWRRLSFPMTEGWARRRADALIGAGLEMTKRLAHWRPDLDRAGRVRHLTYAFDPLDMAVDETLRASILARLAGRPAAVWFGTVTDAFQVFQLLDVGAALEAQGSPMVLIVVGGGPDLNALRGRCAARGLNDRVWIEGFRETRADLAAYMAAADVLVFPFADTPRNRFRCPSKLFQYLAAGKPIVTNRLYEAAWLLGDGGVYAPDGDAAAMAAAIATAVGRPPPRTDVAALSWRTRGDEFVDFIERTVL